MASDSSSTTSLYLILLYFFIGFLTIFFCIYLLHKVWNEKFPPLIPIDDYAFSLNSDEENTHKIGTLSDLFSAFFRLLGPFKFKDRYWIKNCGFDAFSYLCFQREMIGFLTLWLFLLGLDLVFEATLKSITGPSYDYSDLNLLVTLFKSKYHSYKEITFICLITFLYLNNMINFRVRMQESFIQSLNTEGTEPELNWLRLRTVHCKGLLLADVKGILLKKKITEYLRSIGDKGEILAIIVFPDYSRLLRLEKKRLAIKDLEMIYTMEERKPLSCIQRCFPETFNSLEEYERKFAEVEQKMQEELEEVVESSGQCFLCFNNLKTAELCLQRFHTSSIVNFFYSCYVSLKDKCCFRRNANLERGYFSRLNLKRRVSTFTKYSESIVAETENNTRAFFPIMTIAPDPYDINWLNISSTSLSFLFCRRILTNSLILFMMVFLTTPIVLFQVLENDLFFDWVNDLPHPFNEIIQSILPSLFVVLVNQLMLLAIDYTSELEAFSSFSSYQKSCLNKATFYMLLNLLLIPVLTMGTAENIILALFYDMLIDLDQILINFYSNTSLWSFFLMLLLEQGVLAFFCYVLRLKELFLSLNNASFAHYKRTFLNEKAVWRREVDDAFQYGYFSAQMIVSLSITLFFGYEYPLMVIAGIVYFIFRHIGDAYNILIVNKKEINSHGNFIQTVMIHSHIPILLFVMVHIGWLALYARWVQVGFAGIVLLVNLVICFRMKKNLCSTENIAENQRKEEIIKKAAMKWQTFYQHPLIVPGFERYQEEEKVEEKKDEEEKDREESGGKGRRKKKVQFESKRRTKITNLENIEEY